jgi:hypothetical protein
MALIVFFIFFFINFPGSFESLSFSKTNFNLSFLRCFCCVRVAHLSVLSRHHFCSKVSRFCFLNLSVTYLLSFHICSKLGDRRPFAHTSYFSHIDLKQTSFLFLMFNTVLFKKALAFMSGVSFSFIVHLGALAFDEYVSLRLGTSRSESLYVRDALLPLECDRTSARRPGRARPAPRSQH